MRTSGGVRFAIEVAFIVTVAVGTAAARLSNVGIAVTMGAAFLLVAAVEILAPRRGVSRPRARPGRAPKDTREPPPERPAPRAPLDLRPERPPPPPLPTEVAPAGGPAAAAAAAPPAPIRPVREPPPAPRMPPPPAPPPPPPPPRPEPEPVPPEPAPVRSGQTRWNVFELEKLAREVAGQDPNRDEEWRYVLLYLREYADADGSLPPSFDGFIRDSFSELVGAVPA
jgi:hypothetical protein